MLLIWSVRLSLSILSCSLSVSILCGNLDVWELKTETLTSTPKPNYTYKELITLALRDKTSLTVIEIYQWIRSGSDLKQRKLIVIFSENFPYLADDKTKWKKRV